ncbi:ferric reductase-like transmembrane domain-containing protein [Pseudomonas sp. MAP12]|uniref:Ferric reductase-like transmembrane domain-containing protein n=1 Tax=Geopseudomonas aromaticivorans TaxID=2849492 RepID=A0ABS6N1X0_9GAMM|nr:ferric reductase-like transmembrane domain-containing protein [Pseudomonas aromaticivorans]MBV2135055.1 ferric reductase-like transmembrane domain-containing protein [Pseudomonas aromaticivorans]
MKNIKLSYLLLLIVLSLLWLVADNVLTAPYQFFALRSSLVNYTGILAIGVMSFGMFLAIRPISIEPFLGGLDKSYRLHKWLGITALVLSVVHWLLVKAPKWLIGWGWMEKPVRKAATASGPSEPIPAIFQFFRSQRGLAEDLGEWAFYAVVALVVLALLKRFPYRYFFKTHRLLAVVYLVLVFHSLVLMKTAYWSSPIGPLVAVLMLVGTLAAFVSLFRRVGHTRRAVGVIEQLVHHRDNRVLGVEIKLKDSWSGHAAGQFAFVTFDPSEGPHPFTISSSWHNDGKLRFHIKGIGDYTATLPKTLKVGDLVKVEGPYGTFNFRGNQPRQIWVAGGIGITPFIARMQARERHPETRSIDLFYSTSAPDQGFIDKLQQLAKRANVQLHVLVSGKDGRLTADGLCQMVPEWQSASVWFCGPAGFGQSLRQDLLARGLAGEDFHQELFDMR